jgi:hypothetical protein
LDEGIGDTLVSIDPQDPVFQMLFIITSSKVLSPRRTGSGTKESCTGALIHCGAAEG